MRKLCLAVAVILAGFATQANAWWDMGHKQIAALAYSQDGFGLAPGRA